MTKLGRGHGGSPRTARTVRGPPGLGVVGLYVWLTRGGSGRGGWLGP